MPFKSEFTVGLEKVLNNPKVDFFGGSAIFKELQNVTGFRGAELVREVGKKTKESDNQRSARRLEKLEERQTEITEK